jgi:hypothetical protein
MNKEEKTAFYSKYFWERESRLLNYYEKMKDIFSHYTTAEDAEEQKKQAFRAFIKSIIDMEIKEISYMMNDMAIVHE